MFSSLPTFTLASSFVLKLIAEISFLEKIGVILLFIWKFVVPIKCHENPIKQFHLYGGTMYASQRICLAIKHSLSSLRKTFSIFFFLSNLSRECLSILCPEKY